MKITEIAFSSYPVSDMKRAPEFYEGILGLKLSRIFGSETKGFVECDIGPGTLAIGNGADVMKPSAGGAGFIVVLGYLLSSAAEYFILAPFYWYLLFKNLRNYPMGQPPDDTSPPFHSVK